MTGDVLQLPYGRRGRARLPVYGRLALLVVAAAPAVWLAWTYRPDRAPWLWVPTPKEHWARWRQVRREQAAAADCRRFAPEKDYVVYEEGPVAARDWFTRGDGFHETVDGGRIMRSRLPGCLLGLEGRGPDAYRAEMSVLFLGDLRYAGSPSGLVSVNNFAATSDDSPGTIARGPIRECQADTSPPVGITGVRLRNYYLRLFPRLGPDQRLRLFAGVAAPGRPGWFTVAFELDGRPGRFEGHLLEDGAVRMDESTVDGR